jgi:sulfatase modifying factor 1
MKTLRISMLLTCAAMLTSSGEDARFFRIAGPVATTIASFSADGYVTWTNIPTNAIFTVQTASSLLNTTNWVDFVQIPTTSGVNTSRLFDPSGPAGMALIPAGSFRMGDNLDGDFPYGLPIHTNQISAFYMDRYEVTKELWDDVYQWATNHGYDFSFRARGKTNNHPAQLATWYNCVKWCNARSEKENKTPAYYTDVGQTAVYRTGQTDVQNNWVKWEAGYRLPTEAEWEKAMRGGLSGQRYPWGNTITHSHANYFSDEYYVYDLSPTRGYHPIFKVGATPYTSPVGSFPPNGYGLYDMAGNVWEWCWDWYGTYSSSSQTDPRGPLSGSDRVVRGGSWSTVEISCRTGYRFGVSPTYGGNNGGFRTILPPGQ